MNIRERHLPSFPHLLMGLPVPNQYAPRRSASGNENVQTEEKPPEKPDASSVKPDDKLRFFTRGISRRLSSLANANSTYLPSFPLEKLYRFKAPKNFPESRLNKVNETVKKVVIAIGRANAKKLMEGLDKLMSLGININDIQSPDGGNLLDVWVIAYKGHHDKYRWRGYGYPPGDRRIGIRFPVFYLSPIHQTLNLLIQNGINRNNTKNNTTVLHSILSARQPDGRPLRNVKEVIEKILDGNQERESILNYKSNNGNTPAHLAVQTGNEEVWKVLERYHPDLSIKNNEGKSAVFVG